MATSHEGAIEPINAEVKEAAQEVDDNCKSSHLYGDRKVADAIRHLRLELVGQHDGLRAVSRKRLGKYARGEFQRGLVAQEVTLIIKDSYPPLI